MSSSLSMLSERLSPTKPSAGYEVVRKLRKLDDGSSVPVIAQAQPLHEQSPDKQQTKPKIEDPHPQKVPAEPNQQRKKRMLSVMGQHLNKAKITLQSQKQKIKKKVQFEQQSMQSQQSNLNAMRTEKLQLLTKTKQQESKKKIQLSKSLLNVENALLEARMKQYLSKMAGYIPTKCQPTLLWAPAVKNQQLDKLVAGGMDYFKAKQEQAVGQINSVKEPIQFSKVFVQGQVQYLTGKFTRFVRAADQCILTSTKPSIYWKPHTHNQATKKLVAETVEQHKAKVDMVAQSFEKPKHKEASQEMSESENEGESH